MLWKSTGINHPTHNALLSYKETKWTFFLLYKQFFSPFVMSGSQCHWSLLYYDFNSKRMEVAIETNRWKSEEKLNRNIKILSTTTRRSNDDDFEKWQKRLQMTAQIRNMSVSSLWDWQKKIEICTLCLNGCTSPQNLFFQLYLCKTSF